MSDNGQNITAYRVRLLREDHGLSQKALADKLHVAHSQISRLERGETTNINSALLIDLAKEFRVSTDYLLGLTPVSVPKSYDISELGLSEIVVRRLLTGAIDAEIVNRLMEHDQFGTLCALIRTYFDDTLADSFMARNQLIDLGIDPLINLLSTEPSRRSEIIKDLTYLESQKIPPSKVDVEKIRDLLMKILKEIKKDMEAQQPTGAVATAEAIQEIRAALSNKPQSDLTSDDVARAVSAYVGRSIPMDEDTAAAVQQIAKQLLETPLPNKE